MEANYEYSFYICELFNTVSSLAMVIAGLLGMLLHCRVLEARFLLAFFAVSVVGLGSIAFHATLHFELQMLDELPMLYSALVMSFILLENRPTRRFGAWFPALLATHGALVTWLSASTRGPLQFYVFQTSFGSLELFALFRVFTIRRRNPSPVVRRLFRVGMGAYLLAIVAWLTDLELCPVLSVTFPAHGLPNPQLHAVWHVFVSAGLYLLTLLIAHDRLEVLGRDPAVRHVFGFLPRVIASGPPSLRTHAQLTASRVPR